MILEVSGLAWFLASGTFCKLSFLFTLQKHGKSSGRFLYMCVDCFLVGKPFVYGV